MSYAIGNIGYGFMIPYGIQHAAEADGLIEIIEQAEGVHTYYSAGGGVRPLLIGIEVGKIDECNDVDITKDIIQKFILSTSAYSHQADRVRERVIKFIECESVYETSLAIQEFVNYLKTAQSGKIIIWSNS